MNKINRIDFSWEFKIIEFKNRILKIEIIKQLRKLKYEDSFFDWFMEDLILYLEINDFNKRWDFEKLIISGIENLKLTNKQKDMFCNNFKSITNWEMEYKKWK